MVVLNPAQFSFILTKPWKTLKFPKMGLQSYLRRLFLRPSPSPTVSISLTPYIQFLRTHCTKSQGKWLTLPPFTHTINGSSLGKEIYTNNSPEAKAETTAFKWIIKCCPQLPRSLVQKLFRLRQVLISTFLQSCWCYKFDLIWIIYFRYNVEELFVDCGD